MEPVIFVEHEGAMTKTGPVVTGSPPAGWSLEGASPGHDLRGEVLPGRQWGGASRRQLDPLTAHCAAGLAADSCSHGAVAGGSGLSETGLVDVVYGAGWCPQLGTWTTDVVEPGGGDGL